MNGNKLHLTDSELKAARAYFAVLTASVDRKISTNEWYMFDPNDWPGRQIYESFTNEELLEYLRSAAVNLKRNPNKDDVHRLVRIYIKRRFGKWYDAIAEAGLWEKPPTHTEKEIADVVAKMPEDEYFILFQFISSMEVPNFAAAKKNQRKAGKALGLFFGESFTVNEIVAYIENTERVLPPDSKKHFEGQLEQVRQRSRELGRTPLMLELDEGLAFSLWRACGNWKGVLKYAGLSPLNAEELAKAQLEYMLRSASPKLINDNIKHKLTEADLVELQKLCNLARKLKRPLRKNEIPTHVFRRINKVAGSWRAVMTQMGIEAVD